ncbi:hypothetical protein B296_00007749 [Ensete ventricosum]|uniref:Uncharacterized protein n=1 Tax=Ensete ventricosum TaxID=4639 RepID=A0A427AL29_ENSVE|nr:hypothetical protein B296_00007749 [Ensete ventricosum]
MAAWAVGVFVPVVLLIVVNVWLVLRPTKPRFHLKNTTIFRFNLSPPPPWCRPSTTPMSASASSTTAATTTSTSGPRSIQECREPNPTRPEPLALGRTAKREAWIEPATATKGRRPKDSPSSKASGSGTHLEIPAHDPITEAGRQWCNLKYWFVYPTHPPRPHSIGFKLGLQISPSVPRLPSRFLCLSRTERTLEWLPAKDVQDLKFRSNPGGGAIAGLIIPHLFKLCQCFSQFISARLYIAFPLVGCNACFSFLVPL